jgi:long-chain fatty acid transport protein
MFVPPPTWHHLRMRRDARILATAVTPLLTGLLASREARATSTMEIIGASTGGNQITARVLSHGSAATYFNPSLLPEATPKLEVGLFGLALQSSIRLKARPYGVDVPSTVYTSDSPIHPLDTAHLPNLRSNTEEDNNIMYATIGMVRPLAGSSLVFGFHAFLPVRGFLDERVFFVDEREQYFSNKLHFQLLGDRLSVSSITFALGSQLSEWISVGAGIDVAILTQTRVTVFIPDASDQGGALFAPDIHTDSKFKPYFAATLHPNPRSSVVATVHLPSANDTAGQNDLRFWNYDYPKDPETGLPRTSVPQTYTISQGNEPLRVALGASFCGRRWDDGRAPWEIGVQLLAERWSEYRDRQGDHPLDTWSNSLSYAVGGGFLWRDRHVTADLGYIPSPVPDQTGQTNYVDNSRLVASAGIEGSVKFLGRDLEAGFTLFGSYFLPRDVTKDPNAAHPVIDEFPDTSVDPMTGQPSDGAAGLQTNNPGYPGWKSTGFMIGAGATFRIAR